MITDFHYRYFFIDVHPYSSWGNLGVVKMVDGDFLTTSLPFALQHQSRYTAFAIIGTDVTSVKAAKHL